jgi:hypothetical protein
MSYQNLIIYSSVLPGYDFDKDGRDNKKDEVINADDPANRDRINKILFGQ